MVEIGQARVGFVGVGTMGGPMARLLVDAGAHVVVFDRSPQAVDAALADGAIGAASAAEAAGGADIVVMSLPGPSEVHEAVVGADGVLAASPLPTVIADVSTNAVDGVRELEARCRAAGVGFVDAPVSGGVAKARSGELAVLVGGADADVAAAMPALDVIGASVFHIGAIGSGTIAKLVNNQLFLAGSAIVQESYVLAQSLGMDPVTIDGVLAASSAAPFAKLAPLLLSRRFDDVIFRLDIAAKDLRLAVETAGDAGVDVPITTAASDLYQSAIDAGDGELVFHATLRELERRADTELPPLVRPRRPS